MSTGFAKIKEFQGDFAPFGGRATWKQRYTLRSDAECTGDADALHDGLTAR
jgi:hypothetical protein